MRWKLVNDLRQFINTHDISRPEVTFNTYFTLPDLFNPKKNPYFSRHLTVNQHLAFLKSVYTADNIRENFKYFFPTLDGTSEQADFLANLLRTVPADKLWGLAFSREWSGSTRPSFHVYSGTLWGSIDGCYIEPVSNATVEALDITSEAFWTKYSRAITKASNFLSSLTITNGTWRLTGDNYRPAGSIGTLSNFTLDGRIYQVQLGRSSGGNRRPSELLAQMDLEPEAKLNVIRVGSYNFGLQWKVPPNPNDRSQLYQVLSHSANVLDYIPFDQNQLTGPTRETLYGVELETCSNYTIRQLIDAQEKLFFAGKQDGSIQGSGSLKVELVTVPMTLSDHKVAWHKLFRRLDYNQFDTTVDTNNGMHVHVSKKVFDIQRNNEAFKSSHLRKFVWFMSHPGHLPFILAISERKLNSLNAWAPIASYNNMTKGQAYKRAVEMAQSIRGCVNCGTGKSTVEVRLFKGIVSVATICKNLEFVDALIEFTRNASIREVGLSYFFKWLENTARNKYQFLKTFVKQVKTEDMMDGAELFEAIFTEENPERIITILKDKEFPLKNTHIALINRLKGKRTLIMEEGELKLNPQRKAKLFTMDRTFENNYCR